MQVEMKSTGGHEKGRLRIEVLVLPKISLELPMQQVHFDPKWNHLKGLTLADPDIGINQVTQNFFRMIYPLQVNVGN